MQDRCQNGRLPIPLKYGSPLHTRAGSAARHQCWHRLVKDAPLRLLDSDFRNGSQATLTNHDLPLWHLGGVGPFHRRDIYDDAR
jgi:hypothetical protein